MLSLQEKIFYFPKDLNSTIQKEYSQKRTHFQYLPLKGLRKILASVSRSFLTALWISFLAWYVIPMRVFLRYRKTERQFYLHYFSHTHTKASVKSCTWET